MPSVVDQLGKGQAQQFAGVDWSNPLATKAVALVNPVAGWVDAYNGRPMLASNAPVRAFNGITTNGSNSYIARAAATGVAWCDAMTIIGVFTPSAVGVGSGSPLIAFNAAGGVRGGGGLGINASGQIVGIAQTSNGSQYVTGGASAVGVRCVAVVRKPATSSATFDVWCNRVKLGSTAMSGNPAYGGTAAWEFAIGRGSGNDINGATQYGAGTTEWAVVLGRFVSDAELNAIFDNPFQFVEPEQDDTFFSTGSGALILVGAAAAQANTTATGVIAQTHAVTGAAAAQGNASALAALVQVHSLAGAPGAQANTSGTAAIGQTHAVTGAASVQGQSSPGGAIGQVHALNGAASSQGNSASTGVLGGTAILAAAPGAQANVSGTASIGQTHALTGAASVQGQSSAGGAISQVHALAGAASSQANTTPGVMLGSPGIYIPALRRFTSPSRGVTFTCSSRAQAYASPGRTQAYTSPNRSLTLISPARVN